jgi:indolepyruvate ferredoxin oxidoreductase
MPLVMTRLGTAMNPDHIVKWAISSLANQLLGSTTSSNIIMLGWALQKGFIPLGIDAVEAALRLNGTSLENNLAALRWGRLLAHAPDKLFAHLDAITAIPQNEAGTNRSRYGDCLFYRAINKLSKCRLCRAL